MTWGTERWGLDPWGSIVFAPSASGEPLERIVEADVFAHDLVEVVFNGVMKNNSVIQDVASWSVIGTTGDVLTIEEILTGDDVGVRRVYLVISPFNIGEQYTVTASTDMKLTNGAALSGIGNTATFIGRKTKIDSLCSTRPTLFNLSPKSTMRHILNAIGRQDDLIGGSKDEGGDIIR